jgi:uncharacterized protein with HEPN domain
VTAKRDVGVYLDDILDAAGKAVQFTKGMSFDEFQRDERTSYAVIRALEILGEAAKNVPDSVRRRAPELPWQDMAGMRDKLIHAYHGVDLAVVWKTVQGDLPGTMDSIRRVRRELNKLDPSERSGR